MDLSQKMVDEYNKWAVGQGYEALKAHARQTDLLGEPAAGDAATQELESSSFDVAVVSMALHHVSEPSLLLSRLCNMLRSDGGVCIVVDRVPTGEIPSVQPGMSDLGSEVLKTINKQGFTESEMREYFLDAGMGTGFEYIVIEPDFEFTMFGQTVKSTGFIARGERHI